MLQSKQVIQRCEFRIPAACPPLGEYTSTDFVSVRSTAIRNTGLYYQCALGFEELVVQVKACQD